MGRCGLSSLGARVCCTGCHGVGLQEAGAGQEHAVAVPPSPAPHVGWTRGALGYRRARHNSTAMPRTDAPVRTSHRCCRTVPYRVLPYRSYRASRLLHSSMLGALMAAPLAFFEATPIGRCGGTGGPARWGTDAVTCCWHCFGNTWTHN